METKPIRPLGKATAMIEAATQLKVTYAYDDLVFVEHNPFLLRFDEENGERIYVHFNVDCEKKEADRLAKVLAEEAGKEGFLLEGATEYEMYSEEGKDEFQIRFMN